MVVIVSMGKLIFLVYIFGVGSSVDVDFDVLLFYIFIGGVSDLVFFFDFDVFDLGIDDFLFFYFDIDNDVGSGVFFLLFGI